MNTATRSLFCPAMAIVLLSWPVVVLAIDSDSLTPRIWEEMQQSILDEDAAAIRNRLSDYTEKYSEVQPYQKDFLRLATEILNNSETLRSPGPFSYKMPKETEQYMEQVEEELYWLDVNKRSLEKKIPEAEASGQRWFSDNDRQAAVRKQEAKEAVKELRKQLTENERKASNLKSELQLRQAKLETEQFRAESDHRMLKSQSKVARTKLKQEIQSYAQQQFLQQRYTEVIALLHIWNQAVQPDPELSALAIKAAQQQDWLETATRQSAEVIADIQKKIVLERYWDALEMGKSAIKEYQVSIENPDLRVVLVQLVNHKLEPVRTRVAVIEGEIQQLLRLAAADARSAYPKFQEMVKEYPDRPANTSDLAKLRQLISGQTSERYQQSFEMIDELAVHDPEKAMKLVREMLAESVSEEEKTILELQAAKVRTIGLQRHRESIMAEFQMAQELLDAYLEQHPGDAGSGLLPHVSMGSIGNTDIEQVQSAIDIMQGAQNRLSDLMGQEMDSLMKQELQTFRKTAEMKLEFARDVYSNHRANRLASAVFFLVLAVIAVFIPGAVGVYYRKWKRGK
ncbi:MAG: hypothetical protein AAF571_00400 [Verrucomicrobiota bacterium]